MRNKLFGSRYRLFWSFMKTTKPCWGASFESHISLMERRKSIFFKAFDDFEKGIFTSNTPFYLKSRLYISEAMKNLKSDELRGLKVVNVIVDECQYIG